MENSPIKIEYHYHNHVDVADILSQLHIVKMQNRKILERLDKNEQDEELKTEIMRKLNVIISDVKSTV